MNSSSSRLVPSPQLFGPPSWKFLHYIAYGYPETASSGLQQKTLQFFDALPYLLPCERCGEHLHENFKNNSPVESVKTRDGMINYINHLHNVVNQQLGKPVMSRQESEQELFGSSSSNGKKFVTANYIVMLLVFIIGIFIGSVLKYQNFF